MGKSDSSTRLSHPKSPEMLSKKSVCFRTEQHDSRIWDGFGWFQMVSKSHPQGFFQNDALNFLNKYPFFSPSKPTKTALSQDSCDIAHVLFTNIRPTSSQHLPTYHLYAQDTLPLWTHHVAARYTPPRHDRHGGRCLVRNSYHSQSCRRPKLLTRWDESSNRHLCFQFSLVTEITEISFSRALSIHIKPVAEKMYGMIISNLSFRPSKHKYTNT